MKIYCVYRRYAGYEGFFSTKEKAEVYAEKLRQIEEKEHQEYLLLYPNARVLKEKFLVVEEILDSLEVKDEIKLAKV